MKNRIIPVKKILSLVMCLVLSITICLSMPLLASAARTYYDGYGYINGMKYVTSQLSSWYPSTYRYVLFFSPALEANYIYFLVSNSSTISAGNYFYLGSITSTDGKLNYEHDTLLWEARSISDTWFPVQFQNYTNDGYSHIHSGFYMYGIYSEYSTAKLTGKYASDYNDFYIKLATINISALQSLVAQAKSKQDIGYTSSSWQTLQSNIKSSETILVSMLSTQAEVNSAVSSLQSAINGLALLPDASALQALITQAKALKNIGYTHYSWDYLQNQIKSAESLLASKTYTKEQVDSAKDSLQAALDALNMSSVPATSVSVTPNSHVMDVGENFQLSASVSPTNSTIKTVEWTSSDDSVATINSNGVVTALSAGQAVITATTHNGLTATANITVQTPEIQAPENRLAVCVEQGTSIKLCITNDPADNINFTWLSDDTSIATVDSNGQVTGISPGLCEITAKDSSGFNQSIYVRIEESTGTDPDPNPDPDPEITYVKINDDSPQVTYNGAWNYYENDPALHEGDQHYSNEAGAYAEYSFEGTSIRWISSTNSNLGKCDIYLDGERVVQDMDLYSSSVKHQKVLFSKTNLSEGQHTIKIVVTGEKNPLSEDAYVSIDAFECEKSIDVDDGGTEIQYTKINDNDSQIMYGGEWNYYENDPALYAGDQHYSNEAEAYAEYSFEGTSIRWISSTNSNLGKCDIYIDGERVVQGMDLYSSSIGWQKVLFSKTNLSEGQHTIKIVVTGEKNPLSEDAYVSIDAFEYGA